MLSRKSWEGPGQLLGYRAMNQKLMAKLDSEGLEVKTFKEKGKGSLYILSIVMGPEAIWGHQYGVSSDGHDKLCGYQNSTFALSVYGCIDTFPRKILYCLYAIQI